MGNIAQFLPLLSDKSEQNTRFTPADEYLTLKPTSSVSTPTNQISIRKPCITSATLHISGVPLDIADMVDAPNSLLTSIPAVLISQPLLPTPTASETPIPASNRNLVPGTLDDSDDSLSNVSPSSSLGDSETAAPRRSICNKVNPVVYKKFLQGKRLRQDKYFFSTQLTIF